MAGAEQNQVSKDGKPLAGRNAWPLITDPHLHFVTPRLQTALDVWQAKRGPRTMPARGDLTLRDMKKVLANLALLDVVQDSTRTRFKVRVVGSALDDFLSASSTGRFIDEGVPSHFAEKWAALWQPTIAARAPMRTVARVEFPSRRYHVSESLWAPLADDGETPDILLVVVYFHSLNDDDRASQLLREIGEPRSLAVA